MTQAIGRKKREAGQAILLVIVGLSLFVLGALGLALDGSHLYAQRQMAQTAADAAAQAGVMDILRGTNVTGPNPFGTGPSPGPFTCSGSDGRTPCVYARYNGFGAASSDTVTVSFPSAVAGATFDPSLSVAAISVTVRRVVKGTLIRMLGAGPTTIVARATAGITIHAPAACVYALNPSARKVFSMSGGATVTVNCAVDVNSTNSDAGDLTGGAILRATAVRGNFQTSGGAVVTPAPTPLSRAALDPYAALPAPTVASSCDASHTNFSLTAGRTETINPGTYCGGISVSGGAQLTFNPGVYVIKGGNLSVTSYATETGTGVMFYLTGTNSSYGGVQFAGGSNINFTAPTTGPYKGVLFFQDRSITSHVTSSFGGGTNVQLTGGLYFPTTDISYAGGSTGSVVAIVADSIKFTGTSDIVYDPTGLKTGLSQQMAGLME